MVKMAGVSTIMALVYFNNWRPKAFAPRDRYYLSEDYTSDCLLSYFTVKAEPNSTSDQHCEMVEYIEKVFAVLV